MEVEKEERREKTDKYQNMVVKYKLPRNRQQLPSKER